ncbi:MAG: Rib/alpha-like domain-containing protein [Corynebacterium glucuronolyticum]|nr:Rib/alpha-like domain-containing protein [Mycobacteriaceae bacterium]MDY5833986.1 Rib/alpha-like domain-containing protein [Corynebacterium glucuronolyticum]
MKYKPKGFSIAAAAMSLTMILPGVVPVQLPQAIAQTADASSPATPSAAVDSIAESFYASAVDSPGEANAKGTVNGTVVQLQTIPSVWIKDTVSAGKPMGGIEVYAKWTEKEGNSRISSPLYKTTTNEDGTYSINMKPFLDASGKRHEFKANPVLGVEQKLQLWFRAPEGMELFWGYGYRPVPDGVVVDATADWTGSKVAGANAVLRKKDDPSLPNHKPRDQWTVQSPENMKGNNGDISGRVYWNWVQGVGSQRWRDVNNPVYDRGVPGVEVVASYLSDKAISEIVNYHKQNKNSLFNGHDLRGSNWTYDDAVTLNNWIMEQIKSNPDWIAETVAAKTDEKGAYKIRFNGTYGKDNRTPGSVGNKAGTVAGSPNEGGWTNDVSGKDTKHVNWDWMYVSVPDMPHVAGVTTPFRDELWGGSNFAAKDPFGTGNLISSSSVQNLVNEYFAEVNIAALTPHSTFDVLEYDTRTNFASPGTKVDTGASGWPAQPDQKYRISWMSSNANPKNPGLPECEVVADKNGLLPSCPVEVPKDLDEIVTYTATLYALTEDGNIITMGVDSFTAIPAKLHTPVGEVNKPYPLPSPANPVNKQDPERVEGFMEVPTSIGPSEVKWSYELDPSTPLPDGLSLDPESGTINGTPTEYGTFPVKVTAVGTIPAASGNPKQVRVSATNDLIVGKTTMLDYTYAEGEKATKPISVIGLPKGVTATNFRPGPDFPAGFSLSEDGQLTVDETAKAGTYPNVNVTFDVVDNDGVLHTITASGKVVVVEDPALHPQDRDKFTPQVSAETPSVEQGGQITTKPLSFDDPTTSDTVETAPPNTRFDMPDTAALKNEFPDAQPAPDWVTVNPDGSVTANPPVDQEPGIYRIPVRTLYPDGSSEIVLVPIKVTERTPDADRFKPRYGSTPTEVAQVSRGTVGKPSFDDPATQDVQEEAPRNTVFGPAPDTPAWVEVDPATGALTLRPDAKVDVGDYQIPILVTYPDTSTATITAPVRVTEKVLTLAEARVPQYPQATEVAAKGKAEIPVTFDLPNTAETETMPKGTVFSLGPDAPSWAQIDKDTGVITVEPGRETEAKDYSLPVVVTYPDNSVDNVSVPVKVTPHVTDADRNLAAYPGEAAVAPKGVPTVVPAPTLVDGSPVPKDSSFKLGPDAPSWAQVDPVTGAVTVQPGPDVPPKDYTIPVVLTYPDGSTQTIQAPVTVAPLADAVHPRYPSSVTTVPAGSQDSVAAPSFDDPSTPDVETVPAGTTFAKGTGDTGDKVPEWAVVDPQTGALTLKPGVDVAPGDYTVPVVVTYPDGSQSTVNVPVKVSPRITDAQKDQAYYPVANTQVQAGSKATVAPPTFASGSTPQGASFAPGDGAPEWVTVDPQTGEVTARPPRDLAPDDYTIPVKVTYPDGSSEIVNVPFTVTAAPKDAALHDPYYPAKDITVQAGEQAKGEDPSFDDPVTADKVETAPAGTTFSLGPDAPSWAEVDPQSGAVTVTPPSDTTPQNYEIPVVVTYPDQSTDKTTVAVVVTPPKKQAEEYQPVYDTVPVTTQGEVTAVPAPQGEAGNPLPAATTYKAAPDTPPWVKVNPDGSLSVEPDESVEPGTHNVPVVVTYPDQSTETIKVPLRIAPKVTPVEIPDSAKYQPIAPASTDVTAGSTATVPAPTWVDGTAPAGAARYELGADAPSWVTVNPDGSLSLKPDASVEPGTVLVPVDVVYPDGTKDTFYAPVTVMAKVPTAQTAEPRYKANVTAVQAGQTANPGAPTFDDPTTPEVETRPEGTVFTFEGPDWVKLDPVTGQPTLSPGEDVEPKDYAGTVVATYPDGSTDRIPVTITVLPKPKTLSQLHNPMAPVPTPTVVAGEKDKIGAGPNFDDPTTPAKEQAPEGTTFKAGEGAPNWVKVNPDTGELTLNPPADLAPGTYDVPIVATYSDGSVDKGTIPVIVMPKAPELTIADQSEPLYPTRSTRVTAGQEASVAAPSFDDPTTPDKEQAPEKVVFALGQAAPEWVTVDPNTGALTLRPGADVTPGRYDIPVVATYGDQSKDAALVPVTVAEPVKLADTLSPRLNTEKVAGGTLHSAPVTAGDSIYLSPAFDGPVPDNTTFTSDPENPEWVSVSPSGGVSVNPPAGTKPGSYPVKVHVRYPDGSEDVIETTIVVKEAPLAIPSYGPAHAVARGQELVIDPPTVDDPFTDHVETLPEGTTFSRGDGAPTWVTVDPTTGAVVAAPGLDVAPGTYDVPVVVTIGGVTKTITTQLTVMVTDPPVTPQRSEADTYEPFYSGATPRVGQDDELTVPAPTFDDPTTLAVEEKPEKVTFGPSTDAGDPTPPWVTIDPQTGALTLKPTKDVATGGYLVPVKVTYGDGSTETLQVPVIVTESAKKPMRDLARAYYSATAPVIFAGDKASAGTPTFDDPTTVGVVEQAPEGVTFSLGENAPSWAHIDPKTGEIVVDPASDVPTGGHLIAVKVTYADGTWNTAYKRVMIANSKLSYPEVQVGSTPQTVDTNLGDKKVPGAVFELDESTVPRGWTVSVDPNTGAVTVATPANAKPGTHKIRIREKLNGEVISAAELVATVPYPVGAIVGGVLGGLALLGGGAWALSQLGIPDTGSAAGQPGAHARPDGKDLLKDMNPSANQPGPGAGDGAAARQDSPLEPAPSKDGDSAVPQLGGSQAIPGKHAKSDSALAETGVLYVQLSLALGFLSVLLGGAFIALRRREDV